MGQCLVNMPADGQYSDKFFRAWVILFRMLCIDPLFTFPCVFFLLLISLLYSSLCRFPLILPGLFSFPFLFRLFYPLSWSVFPTEAHRPTSTSLLLCVRISCRIFLSPRSSFPPPCQLVHNVDLIWYSNACGTVALLHAVANNRETIGLKEGALMVRILLSLSLSRGHTCTVVDLITGSYLYVVPVPRPENNALPLRY